MFRRLRSLLCIRVSRRAANSRSNAGQRWLADSMATFKNAQRRAQHHGVGRRRGVGDHSILRGVTKQHDEQESP